MLYNMFFFNKAYIFYLFKYYMEKDKPIYFVQKMYLCNFKQTKKINFDDILC